MITIERNSRLPFKLIVFLFMTMTSTESYIDVGNFFLDLIPICIEHAGFIFIVQHAFVLHIFLELLVLGSVVAILSLELIVIFSPGITQLHNSSDSSTDVEGIVY